MSDRTARGSYVAPKYTTGQVRSRHLISSRKNASSTEVVAPDSHQLVLKRMAIPLLNFSVRSSLEQRWENVRLAQFPGVAPIYDCHIRNTQAQTLSPFYPLGSLYDAIAPGNRRLWMLPMSPVEAVRLIVKVAESLYGMHQQRILHGGIKLTNILLERQKGDEIIPLLTDILLHEGITGYQLAASAVYHEKLLDPLYYLAPEQYRQRGLFASDTYALGVVATVLLTGDVPHAQHPLGSFQRNEWPLLRVPSAINPLLDRSYDTVLGKALDPVIRQRYRSPHELATALQSITPVSTMAPILSLPARPVMPSQPLVRPTTSDTLDHEEIFFPEPLAILSEEEGMQQDAPLLPARYQWTDVALKSIPVEKSANVRTQSQTASTIWLRLALVIVFFAVLMVAYLLLLHLTIR